MGAREFYLVETYCERGNLHVCSQQNDKESDYG